jgi:hypothetical protein
MVSSNAKLRLRFGRGKPRPAIERMKGITIICGALIAEQQRLQKAAPDLIATRESLSHVSKQMADR